MPSTPTYGFPYPDLADTPDVPRDIKALAESVDTTVSSTDGDVSALTIRVNALENDTAFGSWQSLTLQNGWSHRAGYYVPGVRVIPGNRAEVIGGLIGGTTDSLTVIATLPIGFRPTADAPLPLLANDGHMYGAFVRVSGDLEIFRPSGASFGAIYLMGSFPLSR